MQDFFINFFYLIGAIIVSIFFYSFLLPAFLGLNKYKGEDDLPLDLIDKSQKEVAEYRKAHNIKLD